jgi:hypothetical protein
MTAVTEPQRHPANGGERGPVNCRSLRGGERGGSERKEALRRSCDRSYGSVSLGMAAHPKP